MMLVKLLRLGRRQLHTIISRDTIKPSSPTPSHLKTYNLSSLDILARHDYVPLILFYPNDRNCSLSVHDKAQKMKKSLSQSLTKYYPFAGRLHTPTTPTNIDCNDEGVVFVESKNDRKLKELQDISEHEETLDQLFADGLVWQNSPLSTNIVGVQLNQFACGGVGVAVSMSHIIGDGCTLASFVNHWAAVARYGSTDNKELLPLNPHFIRYNPSINSIQPESQFINQVYANRVSRKFVFPNTKLSKLKNKVSPLITNPTRVEVLTALLYKTAVAAATVKSGCFKPSYLFIPVDIRNKVVEKLPQTTVGNFLSIMMVPSRHLGETSLSRVVAEIKKEKLELEGIEKVQLADDKFKRLQLRIGKEDLQDVAQRSYLCSSLCGFPYNKADFGWGKPMAATLALRSTDRIGFMLKDTPDGEGMEATVMLEKEDMEIFQIDKEMLSFC